MQTTTQTITQGHLNGFTQCPRRYQYQSLDRLGLPTEPDLQAKTEWGSQFHLLMQQYVLGLAIAPAQYPDPHMGQALEALVAAIPNLGSDTVREAEHRRVWSGFESLPFALVVVYDLLVIEGECAEILDWKTYPKPPNLKHLSENWQTLLYPFVLVETTDYEPEQVAMTYWFVQTGQAPESWRYDYSTPRHEAIKHQLWETLQQIQQLTEQYQQTEQRFPMIDPQQNHRACQYCPFQVRCRQGSYDSEPMLPWSQLMSTIPEVKL